MTFSPTTSSLMIFPESVPVARHSRSSAAGSTPVSRIRPCPFEDLIEDGDRVAARLTARGTHLGEYRGVPATGQLIFMEIFDIVRVADGKIVERWTMFDRGGLLTQLQQSHRPTRDKPSGADTT